MGAGVGRISSLELRRAVQKFNTRLEEVLREHQVAVNLFVKDYHRWFQKRIAVTEVLSTLESTIDKHHHNVNIASLTGASVSLVSGAACIAGLALAPFTGGLSVVLSAGGLLGTSAGSLTMAGARMTDFGLSRSILKRALELVDEDCQETMHLSFIIELCLKHQTEIENIVMGEDFQSMIRQHEDTLAELLTNSLLKERYQRIKKGSATADDIMIIVNFLRSGELIFLNDIHSASKAPFVELKLMEETVRIAATLRSSVSNIKKFTMLFKNWRTGLDFVGVASKASRLAKGAMVGLSMAVDAYEIGSTAKEMASGQKSDASTYLHTLIKEMKHQTDEISEFYNSLNS